MKKKVIRILLILLIISVAGVNGIKYYLENRVGEGIHRIPEKYPQVKEIIYEDLDVGLFSEKAIIRDVEVTWAATGESFNIGEITINRVDRKHGFPHFIDLEVSNMELDTLKEMFKALGEQLLPIGYEKISADITYRHVFDDNRKHLSVNEFTVHAKNMAIFNFKANIHNLDLASLDPGGGNLNMLLSSLVGLTIADAQIIYQDHQLVPKILNHQAKEKGLSSQHYQEQLDQHLTEIIRRSKKTIVRDAMTSIRSFVRNPRKLEIEMAPKKPVSLLQLFMARKPEKILKRLGVTVTSL